MVFLSGKDIFSLKTEELKAELDKRGTLVERLRAAMISEHNSQTFENYQKHSQVKGTPIKTNSHIQDQEIYSFIETRVREVCPHEIEKLQVHRMQQGHPTIDFCKISVRRGKYCQDFSIT